MMPKFIQDTLDHSSSYHFDHT